MEFQIEESVEKIDKLSDQYAIKKSELDKAHSILIENQRQEKQQREALNIILQDYTQAEQDMRRITSKVLLI